MLSLLGIRTTSLVPRSASLLPCLTDTHAECCAGIFVSLTTWQVCFVPFQIVTVRSEGLLSSTLCMLASRISYLSSRLPPIVFHSFMTGNILVSILGLDSGAVFTTNLVLSDPIFNRVPVGRKIISA